MNAFVEQIRRFNHLAGNTDSTFNARQTALYTGMQCEELAEKLARLGYDDLASELDAVGMDMKNGEIDYVIESVDRQKMLDDDVDLIVVTIGSMLSQAADIDGALNEVGRANLAKTWPDGTLHKDANGKVIKPFGFIPPDLSLFVCPGGMTE